jgi:hypothetical protein
MCRGATTCPRTVHSIGHETAVSCGQKNRLQEVRRAVRSQRQVADQGDRWRASGRPCWAFRGCLLFAGTALLTKLRHHRWQADNRRDACCGTRREWRHRPTPTRSMDLLAIP